MKEDAQLFLGKFVEEFPGALEESSVLPVNPLSRRMTLEELHGESLELGLRLLNNRGCPPGLGAQLCQAAVAKLLKSDLSSFHCAQEDDLNQEDGEKEILLQSEVVLRFFLNKLVEVGLVWYKDPPQLKPPSSRFLQCSVHAIKNTRRKMEDKHLVLPEFNQLLGLQDGVERAYYAVFDGHGGVDAATYASIHLHVVLSQQKTLQSDAAAAFKSAFKHTDEMFRSKAKRERLRSGSTGVAILIQDQELTVSWLGDSQALLVRKGQAITVMNPHKPEREDEKKRIEDLGGCITFMGCWRVNGTYAVSRAIGDFDQKPYISGDADCSTVQLQGDEDYFLLACDGFFDAVKPSEVPSLVVEALRPSRDAEGDGSPDQCQEKTVAEKLVGFAKSAGSSDNITVIIVFLRPPEQLLTTAPEDATFQDASQQPVAMTHAS